MKFIIRLIKRLFIGILILLLIGVVLLFATDNQYVFRGVKLTYLKGEVTANIDDYVDFDLRRINNGTPQPWKLHKDYNKTPLTDTLLKELETLETAGFLIIKDGEIITEHYFNGYSDTSLTNSFSIAKTFTTMLLGKAIEDGYIKSLEQPITDFLPEYNNDSLAKMCTVGNLSSMTDGYDWDENYYFPINPTAKAYYGRDITNQMLSRSFVSKSGQGFDYKSGSTQLLGIIITRATGKKLSEYLSEKFWIPLGMKQNSFWSLDDENGMEKAYCCVHSNVRDYAKMGQLLLQNGNWNGKQLLDSTFVSKMITPNYKAFRSQPIYGYGLWMDYEHTPNFYAMVGHLGQKIICIPSENMVIVRMGKLMDRRNLRLGPIPGQETYYWVDEAMKMHKK